MVTWYGENPLGTESSLYRWHLTAANPLTASLPRWPRPQPQPTNSLTLGAFDVNQSQHLYMERASTAGCSHIYNYIFPSECHRAKTHAAKEKFEREIEWNIKTHSLFEEVWHSSLAHTITIKNIEKSANIRKEIQYRKYLSPTTVQ